MGTKYLMGAASATIAKFLWCEVMILEGAHDPEASRLAVSVLGGVHAGIKRILAKSRIQSLEGLQCTDSRTAKDERLPGVKWQLGRSRFEDHSTEVVQRRFWKVEEGTTTGGSSFAAPIACCNTKHGSFDRGLALIGRSYVRVNESRVPARVASACSAAIERLVQNLASGFVGT
jgi:hypothetical protein